MATVGKAEVILTATDKASKKIQRVGRIIKTALNVAGIYVGFRLLSKGVGDVLAAYNKQIAADVQLATVLRSTGNVMDTTTEALKAHASALQSVTTFGDETIQASQALLLTFKNIGSEIFDRTTVAVLDVATAMGTDLKSASIQLGKALNDPILGISALSRTGITFTEKQKATIKSLVDMGDAASAQKIILKELESQFGGSAKAMATTFGGAVKQLNNLIGDSKEKFGELIATAVQPYIRVLSDEFITLNGELGKTGEAQDKVTNSADGLFNVMATVGRAAVLVKAGFIAFGEILGRLTSTTIATFQMGLQKTAVLLLQVRLGFAKAFKKDTKVAAISKEINRLNQEIAVNGEIQKSTLKDVVTSTNSAAKALEDYDKKIFTARENLAKYRAENKEGSEEQKKAEAELLRLQKERESVWKGNLNTIKGLEDQIKKYREQLSELNIGSEEFNKTLEAMTILEERLKEATGSSTAGINEQKTALESFAGLLDTIQSKTADTFAAFSGLFENQKSDLQEKYDLEKEQIEQTSADSKSKAALLEKLDKKYLDQQKKIGKKLKAIKLAQAISNTALGVTTALAKQDYVGAALIGIAGGLQIAKIASSEYARGGIVAGPGSSTGDNIPAFLSRGEAVIPSDVVKAYPDEVNNLLRGESGGSMRPVIINASGRYEQFISVLFDDIYQASIQGRLFIDERAETTPALI